MSGLFGGGKQPQAAAVPTISGLQLQTSAYGKAIPVVYGMTRLAPNLFDYQDFAQKSVTTGGGGGGKGGPGAAATAAAGGGGGGALQITALNALTVTGVIHASGAGGDGGTKSASDSGAGA
ncbi:MAG TPA: hypothetical protein VNH17_17480, partial [Streptosporangiaceae bacterium]|nr:hypothetical protein [Streptosporangiaceae bacterium]